MTIKRNGHVCYLRTKPSMPMYFWNIQSFEQLERSLNRWLDGEINDRKKIKSIERLVSYISIAYENNVIQRM